MDRQGACLILRDDDQVRRIRAEDVQQGHLVVGQAGPCLLEGAGPGILDRRVPGIVVLQAADQRLQLFVDLAAFGPQPGDQRDVACLDRPGLLPVDPVVELADAGEKAGLLGPQALTDAADVGGAARPRASRKTRAVPRSAAVNAASQPSGLPSASASRPERPTSRGNSSASCSPSCQLARLGLDALPADALQDVGGQLVDAEAPAQLGGGRGLSQGILLDDRPRIEHRDRQGQCVEALGSQLIDGLRPALRLIA